MTWEKRAVLRIGDRSVCACREQYPSAKQQMIATCFTIYGVNPSISWRCVRGIHSEKKWENRMCEMVEGCKRRDLEVGLIIWIGQVNVKNGAAAVEVTKEKGMYLDSSRVHCTQK
jgi:hypothetical protein